MKGLGPEDFRIFEDERPQPVTHFIGADAERELVVAVDMSGSMTAGDAAPAATPSSSSWRRCGRWTTRRCSPSTTPCSRSRAATRRRTRACARSTACVAWGSTAFHDAVLRGLELLERHRGRRALVLFTDGEDMVSHATVEDVQRGSR